LQQVGTLACLAGIEFRVGLAGLLLELEFFGTVIPVSDFLGLSGFPNEFTKHFGLMQ
jgi:hypothetical protein